jgi:hypothetical protein
VDLLPKGSLASHHQVTVTWREAAVGECLQKVDQLVLPALPRQRLHGKRERRAVQTLG